jgi:UDP-N-acetylmuramoyl-tripeptide--D-alanyl-D-alanine ligase
MIEKLHQLFLKQGKVTTDSRNIPAGSIFFALKGANFDGNTFAMKALADGASYAVVDNPDVVSGERFILVKDVLSALQELARFHRLYLKIPIVGITGSNGKTTTKELVREVLSRKYRVVSTQGNLNNHIGVPLTLLSMDSSIEIGIVEMGANHSGDIAELCDIALPDYGLITNISAAHLLGFGSLEMVIKTKSELYQSVINRKGSVFYNSGNSILQELLKDKDVAKITFGVTDSDKVKGVLRNTGPFLALDAIIDSDKISIQTNLLGGYNFENVLAALCVGSYFGVSADQMKAAVEAYTPSNNRSQFVKTEQNSLWVDCYNANPSSMAAALLHFSNTSEKKTLAVILGDMLELGEESQKKHVEIISMLKELGLKEAYLVGAEFKQTGNFGLHFDTVDDLKNYIKVHPIKGKTVLVKGSRGIQLEKVLTDL